MSAGSTLRIPYFVAGESDEVAALATVPAGEFVSPGILVLHGRAPSRARNPLGRMVAGHFAPLGHPVLTIDYPGSGLSPGLHTRSRPTDAPAARAAAVDFLERTGVDELVVVGTCSGAVLALDMADIEGVTTVIALSLLLGARPTREVPMRSALDVLRRRGPRALVRRIKKRRRATAANPEGWTLPQGKVRAEVERAAAGARVHLIFGSEDAHWSRLEEAEAAHGPLASDRVTTEVWAGRRLYPQVAEKDEPWVLTELEKAIIDDRQRQGTAQGADQRVASSDR